MQETQYLVLWGVWSTPLLMRKQHRSYKWRWVSQEDRQQLNWLCLVLLSPAMKEQPLVPVLSGQLAWTVSSRVSDDCDHTLTGLWGVIQTHSAPCLDELQVHHTTGHPLPGWSHRLQINTDTLSTRSTTGLVCLDNAQRGGGLLPRHSSRPGRWSSRPPHHQPGPGCVTSCSIRPRPTVLTHICNHRSLASILCFLSCRHFVFIALQHTHLIAM